MREGFPEYDVFLKPGTNSEESAFFFGTKNYLQPGVEAL